MDAGHVGSSTVCGQGHASRVPAERCDVCLHPGQGRQLVQQPPVATNLSRTCRKREAFCPLRFHNLDFQSLPWCLSQAHGATGGPGFLTVQVGTVGTAWAPEAGASGLCRAGDPDAVLLFLWAAAFPPLPRPRAGPAAYIGVSALSDHYLAWHIGGDAPRLGPLWWLSTPPPPLTRTRRG